MKKERVIKIGILSIVFVLAMIVFSYWTNRGSADMTADMGGATLPTLSFWVEGKEANLLIGHKREMNIAAMRDTIAVYGDKKALTMNVQRYDSQIDALTYQIYTLEGAEKLLEKEVKNVKDSVKLELGDALKKDQEGLLKVTLQIGKTPIYYYTRIVKDNSFHIKECVEWAYEFHNNLIKKENDDQVKKVLESNEKGDNTTYQHVTIHSDLNHVMWGELNPKVLGTPRLEIKETKKAYTSMLLRYEVQFAGDNNKEERYQVKEFLKVSYRDGKTYLLEYDRTMEEVFNTSNVVLSAKGVVLGIANPNLPHKINQKGTIVAFIQGNELWTYNKEKDSFSLIFSFMSAEKKDVRYCTDKHEINILSMEENGNMTFSVCGYMNRGIHEGESGVALYYYNMGQSAVEEVAFIPSKESLPVIQKELSELAYYNQEQGFLYTVLDDSLIKIKVKKKEQTVLLDGLQKGNYVSSKDGHLLAYQGTKDGKTVTEVWDFAKDTTQEIAAESGEIVVPLGFVGDDFVYGLSKPENVGKDAYGVTVSAMHRLEIRNTANKVVKTYEKKDTFILDATVEGNQITLRQGTKEGSNYAEAAKDYITNNETTVNENISFKSYWTDLKETQYRFVFSEGIQDKKAKILKPKQVLQERPMVLEPEKENTTPYFYVYGLGEQAGAFESVGDAIELAKKLSGVVISPEQHYAWEDGNRVAWYRNFNITGFQANANESSLEACVRRLLTYRSKKVDVAAEMATKSAEQVLSEQLKEEVIKYQGCSVKDLFYLVDKGVPVIALKNGTQAVLLIGYDAKTVTYADPKDGGIYTRSIEAADGIFAGSGRTFIGYVR